MENIINCYGDENKKRLIENYVISPVLYLGLLPNQYKNGCCGRLTTNYYIFYAINKITKKEISFYAGKHCAEKILELIQKPKLEFSNPLHSNSSVKSQNENHQTGSSNNIDIVNKELINAIRLISVAWSSVPPPSVLKIIDFTLNKPTIPNHKGIKWINGYISKDYKNRTLTQIVQDLKNEYPDLRNFNFERLKNIMSEKFPEEINKF